MQANIAIEATKVKRANNFFMALDGLNVLESFFEIDRASANGFLNVYFNLFCVLENLIGVVAASEHC